MRLLLWCGLLALGGAVRGETTYGGWRSGRIGGGGYIQHVVLCPSAPGRVYSYVDVGGVYRSDDGGQTWRMLHGALPPAPGSYSVRSLTVDPRDADTLIIAVGDQWPAPLGLFRSTDGGASFTPALTLPFAGNGHFRGAGVLLARDPVNPDIVLTAAPRAGVWRSADNGLTWTKLGAEGLFPTDLRFDRTNSRRLWLCAKPMADYWLNGEKQSLAGGFYRSDDGGVTWDKLADNGPGEVLQDPLRPAVLYGDGDGDGVVRSTDGGATWAPFNTGLKVDPQWSDYTSDARYRAFAAGPDFVLTASSQGTFYRLDAGANDWRKIDRQGYEQGDWYGRTTGRRGEWVHFGKALSSIVVDPADPRHWYFTDWYAIYQTRDAGATWTLTIDGIEATVIHCLEQDPLRPGLIHLGMADNGYFRSTDGGTTWRRPETQPGNNTRCLAVCQSQPDVLYATGPATHGWRANQVYVSRDAGATWTRCGTAGLPELANRNTNTVAVDPRDPTRVWLTVDGAVEPGGGGPYVSRDGGATWTWAGAGLEGRNWFYQGSIWDKGRQLDIDPAGRVLTLSPRHNDRVFARDEATGQWLERPTPGRGVLSLAADPLRPGRWFLSGPGGVRVSLDGGVTWRQTYEGETGVLVVDRRAPDLVAAGRPDGLIVSRDGGATWQPADPALPYRRNPVPGLAGERLLAATAGSGVFYLELPR